MSKLLPISKVLQFITKEGSCEDNVALDLLKMGDGLPGKDVASSVVDRHHLLCVLQRSVTGVIALWVGARIVHQNI